MANPFIHSVPPVEAHGTGVSLSAPFVSSRAESSTTTSGPLTSNTTSYTTTTNTGGSNTDPISQRVLEQAQKEYRTAQPTRDKERERQLERESIQREKERRQEVEGRRSERDRDRDRDRERDWDSDRDRDRTIDDSSDIRERIDSNRTGGKMKSEDIAGASSDVAGDEGIRQRRQQKKDISGTGGVKGKVVDDSDAVIVEEHHLNFLNFMEKTLASPRKIFYFLLPLQLISAFFNPVGDCDETFNYWEPTHYLLYGYGLQTWEYSPVYALRSYIFILLHVAIAKVFQLLMIESIFGKAAVFYCVRAVLGAGTALCESQFVYQIASLRKFGTSVSSFLLCFLAFAPGMFHASTSYLPQSFAMNMILLSFSNWLSRDYDYAVFFMGLAGLIGWPFCVLMGIPMAVDMVRHIGMTRFARYAGISAAIALIPSIFVDWSFYHRMVIAPLNIALYNSSSTAGANLYGQEPWTFYVKNLLLNFNVAYVLFYPALIMGLIMNFSVSTNPVHRIRASAMWKYCFGPTLIWLSLMTMMPHKEERFLYIVYPFICLSAAYVSGEVFNILSRRMTEVPKTASVPVSGSPDHVRTASPQNRRAFHHLLRRVWEGAIVFTFILFSLSRNYAMVHNYSAPLHVYGYLHELEHKESLFHTTGGKSLPSLSEVLANTTTRHVCVGKEWYRFPSNFFFPAYTLPGGYSVDGRATKYHRHPRLDLHFLKSDFSGLLPKPFAPYPAGTWEIPTNMNDMNREEPTRYSELSVCDYIVDLDLPHQREPHYARLPDWKVVYEAPFLDTTASPIWSRAFHVPGISSRFNRYGSYQLLKRSAAAA